MKTVKMHGQSVDCYGELGEYSSFYFTFDDESFDDYYDVDVKDTWEATIEPMVIWAAKEGTEIVEVSTDN